MEGNGLEDEGDVVGGQGKHKVTGVGLAPDTGESQRSRSQGRYEAQLLTALQGNNIPVNLDGQP